MLATTQNANSASAKPYLDFDGSLLDLSGFSSEEFVGPPTRDEWCMDEMEARYYQDTSEED